MVSSDVQLVAGWIAYSGSVRGALSHLPCWEAKDPGVAWRWLRDNADEVSAEVLEYEAAARNVLGNSAEVLRDRLIGEAVDKLVTAAVSLLGKDTDGGMRPVDFKAEVASLGATGLYTDET